MTRPLRLRCVAGSQTAAPGPGCRLNNFERKPDPAMPRFRVHQPVAYEFREVLAWYAGMSPLAAENFVWSFDVALKRVQRHPTAHAPWKPPFRRIRLVRFPYLLLFHADRRATSVLALVHERREPGPTFSNLARRRIDLG